MEKLTGLSDEQAEQLHAQGFGNKPVRPATKSYKNILFENIFSIFNLLNIFIAVSLAYVGSIKNCLFMLAVISNTMIGIIQEIRSKRVVDRLSIVSSTKVTAIRSGEKRELDLTQLVKGDLIVLSGGNQVPNDCRVVSGMCEVNESMLTGESDSIVKREGDSLLSGSFLMSGECVCEITAVGSESYANSLLSEIKYVKKSPSEIVAVLKRLIAVITVCIVPLGALLFYNQLSQTDVTFREAVESTAAALIGMIPEGLVLLTSTVFALGVVRLSRKNVLSQDLYSLEALARADVLCLDKTGTITTGEMHVEQIVPAADSSRDHLEELLHAFACASPDKNATAIALKSMFGGDYSSAYSTVSVCPFSSERKWAAVTVSGISGENAAPLSIVVGSGEMIFGEQIDYSAISRSDHTHFRILTVAESSEMIAEFKLPSDLRPAGFVLLSETLREGVGETLDYFKSNSVEIKIISGDNPETVKRLCSSVMGDECLCQDLSCIKDDEIAAAAVETQIFGRATPAQKKLIVKTLKESGKKVVMVGDGVNDVLALKESDCSIAPANGSAAARNVAQLVLLDSEFGSLPAVVGEGRRSVNNLQTSASLFLSKTGFSFLMALIFIFIDHEYPLEPIQMTLFSALTIGFPSFILSFVKNNKPIKGSFLPNIMKRAIPTALAELCSVLLVVLIWGNDLSDHEIGALCVFALVLAGVALTLTLDKPLTPLRLTVAALSAAGFAVAYIFFGQFFSLAPLSGRMDIYMVIIAAFDLSFLFMLTFIAEKLTSEK